MTNGNEEGNLRGKFGDWSWKVVTNQLSVKEGWKSFWLILLFVINLLQGKWFECEPTVKVKRKRHLTIVLRINLRNAKHQGRKNIKTFKSRQSKYLQLQTLSLENVVIRNLSNYHIGESPEVSGHQFSGTVYGSIACIKYAFALYMIMLQFMNVFSFILLTIIGTVD